MTANRTAAENQTDLSGCVDLLEKKFPRQRILVLGDLMVDEYITGTVKRISPEAPVPVLNYQKTSRTVGGASNVMKNIRTLGAEVWAAGVAAEDEAGGWLREQFRETGVHIEGILAEPERPTIVKTRYATKGQQLLPVDKENCGEISDSTKQKLLCFLERKSQDLDALILSDYCKGVCLDSGFIRDVIALCKAKGIFVAIDSKSRDVSCFEGADFVKPNNLELEAAVGVQIVDEDSLNLAGNRYLEMAGIPTLIVTRGARGISVFQKGCPREDFAAAREVQVYDVTGAGDTVISTITLALISGADMKTAVRLANLAAGIVISQVGTVTIRWQELKERIYETESISVSE